MGPKDEGVAEALRHLPTVSLAHASSGRNDLVDQTGVEPVTS